MADELYKSLLQKATGIGAPLEVTRGEMPLSPGDFPRGLAQGATRASRLMQDLFEKVPGARQAYERYMSQFGQQPQQKALQDIAAHRAGQQENMGRAMDAHDALLDVMVDRPRPIRTATGFETAIPKGIQPRASSPLPEPPGLSQRPPAVDMPAPAGVGQGVTKPPMTAYERVAAKGRPREQVASGARRLAPERQALIRQLAGTGKDYMAIAGELGMSPGVVKALIGR